MNHPTVISLKNQILQSGTIDTVTTQQGDTYMVLRSPMLVTEYQEFTYITESKYIQRGRMLAPSDLEEFISEGHECYLANPDELGRVDPKLKEFFDLDWAR